jgi:uncharacterized protein
MSAETARKAINYLTSATHSKQLSLIFWGGEPLLNYSLIRWCVEYSGRFNDFKWTYSLITNGVLIDEEKARFFAQNNFTIGISIDGTKEIHDSKRVRSDGSGTFDEAARGADLLYKASVPRIHVSCVLGKEYIHKHAEIYKELISRFPYSLVAIIPEDLIKYEMDTPSLAEISSISLRADRETGAEPIPEYSRNLVVGVANSFLRGSMEKLHACQQGLNTISVTPDEKINLCQHTVMMPDKEFKGGDLENTDPSQISATVLSYPKKCTECYAFAFCSQQACHIRRFKFGESPPEHVCRQTDSMFEKVIEFISSMDYGELLTKFINAREDKNFKPAAFLMLRQSFKHIKPIGIAACPTCKARLNSNS